MWIVIGNNQGQEQGRSNAKAPGLPEKETGPSKTNPCFIPKMEAEF